MANGKGRENEGCMGCDKAGVAVHAWVMAMWALSAGHTAATHHWVPVVCPDKALAIAGRLRLQVFDVESFGSRGGRCSSGSRHALAGLRLCSHHQITPRAQKVAGGGKGRRRGLPT